MSYKWLTIFGLVVCSNSHAGLSLVTAGPSASNLCSKVFGGFQGTAGYSAPLYQTKVGQEMRIGTGNGKLITVQPKSIKVGNETMTAIVELQRDEKDAILLLMDKNADHIIHEITLGTDVVKRFAPFTSRNGTFVAVFGHNLVAPKPGVELFVVDPKSGQVREFLLPEGTGPSRTLLPQAPGEPILTFNEKGTFELFDSTFLKKTEEWSLERYVPSEHAEKTSLHRVPGTKDQVLLVSSERILLINTATKSVEWSKEGKFDNQMSIAQTPEGPIFQSIDFYANRTTKKIQMHIINLRTKASTAISVGNPNDYVVQSETFNSGSGTYTALLSNVDSRHSTLSLLNLQTHQIEWSSAVPTNVHAIKLVNNEGQAPLIVLSRPAYMPFKMAYPKGQTTALKFPPPAEASAPKELNPIHEAREQRKELEGYYDSSMGYIFSTSGQLLASPQFWGGLKTSPIVIQKNGEIQIKYQDMLRGTLNTLIVK